MRTGINLLSDERQLSPEELYANGLRQSKVGTPYFFDNDDDDIYHKLLKKNDEYFATRMSGVNKWKDIAAAANESGGEDHGDLKKANKGWGDDYNNEEEGDNDNQSPRQKALKSEQLKIDTTPSRSGREVSGRRNSGASPSTRRTSLGDPNSPNFRQQSKLQIRERKKELEQALFGQDVFDTIQKAHKANKKQSQRQPGLKGTIIYFFNIIPVKSPKSRTRQIWDMVSILFIVFSAFLAMYDLAFFPESHLSTIDDSVWFLSQLSETFFWVDLIFNFFTAEFDREGDLITNKKEIAKIYVSYWFWIDFVSNLPLSGGLKLNKILRFLRIPRVINRWAFLGYSWKFLNIFKLTLTIGVSGHFVACLFYMIARMEEHAVDNWTHIDGLYAYSDDYQDCLDNDGGDAQSCVDIDETAVMQNTRSFHYVSALYFAYATLTTVGYGDIKASTSGERTVALVALVLGSAVFAGVVGTMSQLMEGIDEIEQLKLTKLKQMQYFIKSNHFPNEVRVRIRKFFDLKVNLMRKELTLLDELPPLLKNDCLAHIYMGQLETCPFLLECSEVSRSAFCGALSVQLIGEKDYILVQGQCLDRMFVVNSGIIEIINNRGMICRRSTQGSFFCEKCAFFEGELSAVSYRAKADVELLFIEREHLIYVLNIYHDLAAEFVMACQKREEQKAERMEGASKYTVFKNKNAETMFRPSTPPPGVEWGEQKDKNRPPTFEEMYLKHDDPEIQERLDRATVVAPRPRRESSMSAQNSSDDASTTIAALQMANNSQMLENKVERENNRLTLRMEQLENAVLNAIASISGGGGGDGGAVGGALTLKSIPDIALAGPPRGVEDE